MIATVRKKSKTKAVGGSINEKILGKLSKAFKKKCVYEVNTNIFPDFNPTGKFDRRYKEKEYTVIMERIYREGKNNETADEKREKESEKDETKDVDMYDEIMDDEIMDDEIMDDIKIDDISESSESEELKLSPANTPDNLTKEHEWKIPEDTNKLCEYVINYCRENYKVPPQAIMKVHVGKYMRMVSTKISPPDKSTLNRVIFNFNNSDVYRLEPGPSDVESTLKDIKKAMNKDEESEESEESEIKMPGFNINKQLEARTVYLEEGRVFPMGPFTQSNYIINLNSGKEIRIPPKIQSKMKIRGQKTIYKLKSPNYQRVTIVVDTCVSSELVDKITKETIKQVNQNKDILTDVETKMKESGKNIKDIMKDVTGMEQPGSVNKKKKKRRRRKKKIVNKDDDDLMDMI